MGRLSLAVLNKVINKQQGLLFIGIVGPAGRLPTLHAWIALVWTIMSGWVAFQGFCLQAQVEQLPRAYVKRVDAKFGGVAKFNLILRPGHRFFGAVAFTIGLAAAGSGLWKFPNDGGRLQAMGLALIWAVLYLPHLGSVFGDLMALVRATSKIG